MMDDQRLADIETQHDDHCAYKCCGGKPWSHHPEQDEQMCPSLELTIEVRRLRGELNEWRQSAIERADRG